MSPASGVEADTGLGAFAPVTVTVTVTATLEAICRELECQPGDLLGYVGGREG
ncbi:MAG: helix-turn-helix domain-containing protein [Sphingomonadales bacterium]|nr:helix-turn-helix domain-containing protein [Sphingomonadales bacterium]MDE2569796.1 helix-turn-helix domain-containing protein [Sphingomonadales bacterium]